MRALSDDFAEHGATVNARLRETEPATYVQVIASLMPRSLEPNRPREALADDELIGAIDLMRRLLDAGEAAHQALDRAARGERDTRPQVE